VSVTLVRNGTVITADAPARRADVLIEDGVITRIGTATGAVPDAVAGAVAGAVADTVVDAAGLLVMPGGIDAHTHLDMPFGSTTNADDFESGTIAAACGGTTTVIDFATPEAGEALYAALDQWHGRAAGKAVIDYGFHMVVREFDDRVAAEMDRLTRDDGVTSFKLFMAYPGRLMASDETIRQALVRSRNNGALICLHAENGPVIETLIREALARGETAPKYHARTRPSSTEGEAAGRAMALAEQAGARVYIVHVSCSEAAGEIRRARDRGVAAFGETCPQYLFLSDEEYERPGFEGAKFVMSPPLRPRWHQDVLWKALQDDVLQVVATDHCPFCMDRPDHKPLGLHDFSKIPNGAPGIETRLMLLWDGGVRAGRIDEQRFVELTAAGPAKMFGLWPRKGTIAIGSDGDLMVWDPTRETTLAAATLHMRVDYNPYEGRVVRGGPVAVVSRGDLIVDRGRFVGRPGRGQFLKRGHA